MDNDLTRHINISTGKLKNETILCPLDGETLGKYIKTLRKMQGKALTGVGNEVKMSYQQVKKYEDNTTSISIKNANKLFEALDCKIEILLTADNTQDKHKLNSETFGQYIKNLRILQCKTLTDVGKAAKVSYQQVKKYENNKTAISIKNANKIVKALGFEMEILLTPIEKESSNS
jgi:transcriptional regulator with XRE-family HTH domain